MRLKVGIIVIGSLLWDNSPKRKFWRKNNLNSTIKKPVKLPIRYGRISSSRMDTYSMTYSMNLKKKEYGQGIVLEFNNPVTSIESLKEISENVIRVERDKTKAEWEVVKSGEPFTLNWNWGVLGICVNPKYFKEKETPEDILKILEFWKNSLVNFNPADFSLKNESSMIDDKGTFKIEWTTNIEKYDILISTVIQPNTDTENGDYPNSEIIAKKMYEGNYYSYFIKNIQNSILTNNDLNIKELIKSKYCVSNFLKELK